MNRMHWWCRRCCCCCVCKCHCVWVTCVSNKSACININPLTDVSGDFQSPPESYYCFPCSLPHAWFILLYFRFLFHSHFLSVIFSRFIELSAATFVVLICFSSHSKDHSVVYLRHFENQLSLSLSLHRLLFIYSVAAFFLSLSLSNLRC